jgi:hypothetical protein
VDPSNQNSIIDIQNEAESSRNKVNRQKASASLSDEETGDENDDVSTDVNIDILNDHDGAGDTKILPMPVSSGIESLRGCYMLECHSCVEEAATKIIYWRRDERKRAAMRERRKETREKIRTEEVQGQRERKRESRDKGNVTKVIDFVVQY